MTLFGLHGHKNNMPAPFICPWHFKKDSPRIIRNGIRLHWHDVTFGSPNIRDIKALAAGKGVYLGLVGMYANLLPDSVGKYFLVWKRDSSPGTSGIDLCLYASDELDPLSDVNDLASKMSTGKELQWHFNAQPVASIRIPYYSPEKLGKLDIPKEAARFNEICVVEEIPGLYAAAINAGWWNTAIIRVDFTHGKAGIYPQDWFNNSGADFGYEWITRAKVNRRTGRIQGEGMRISAFELDESNRQLKAR